MNYADEEITARNILTVIDLISDKDRDRIRNSSMHFVRLTVDYSEPSWIRVELSNIDKKKRDGSIQFETQSMLALIFNPNDPRL